MSVELEAKKITVATAQKDCEELLVEIVSERRVADEQKKQASCALPVLVGGTDDVAATGEARFFANDHSEPTAANHLRDRCNVNPYSTEKCIQHLFQVVLQPKGGCSCKRATKKTATANSGSPKANLRVYYCCCFFIRKTIVLGKGEGRERVSRAGNYAATSTVRVPGHFILNP